MNYIRTLIIDGLTYKKFQESPIKFLHTLKNIKKLHYSQDTYNSFSEYEDTHYLLIQYLNDTIPYETWYSPPIQWVFYATGNLVDNNNSQSFFTSDISISQEMGINIFDLMVELGSDINIKNYYGNDIRELVCTNHYTTLALTQRTNNEKFLTHIIYKYLYNHSHNFNNYSKKENILYNIINKILPEAAIFNCSNESDTSNFIIEINNIKLMIENKDYKEHVKKNEVSNFYRNIKKHNCHGIFLSQNSSIATKNDLEIRSFNNNIIIFAHNVNYNHNKIKLLINTILYLHNILKSTKNVVFQLNNKYINVTNQKNILINKLKDYYNKTLKTYNDLHINSLQLVLSSYCKKSVTKYKKNFKRKHVFIEESP